MTNGTFLIDLLHMDTGEMRLIVAESQDQVKLILNRIPESFVVSSITNVGPTTKCFDFLSELTDNGNMNFGSH